MYEAFSRSFVADSINQPPATPLEHAENPWLPTLLHRFGGTSFNRGLYRIVSPADLTAWRDRIATAFPEFTGRLTCFGYDWLGRAFTLDRGRQEEAEPAVLMLDPGAGEALEVPCNLRTFHDSELVDFPDAALAVELHANWLRAGGGVPNLHQCVGYKTVLFLGGADQRENLELTDLDVYWHISGQLRAKTCGLKPGDRIGGINIGE